MKTNIIKVCAALIVVGFVMIPSFAGAQVPSTDGGDVGGADSNTASGDAPSTTGGDVGGADQNSNPGGFTPGTDGGDTGGADTGAPSNPSNPDNGDGDVDNDGDRSGVSGSSRNRSSGSNVVVVNPSGLPVLINISNCLYINNYLKLGGVNNTSEVTKLQTFLKNTEKLDVDINGIFDQKTFDAVKAFQAKYVNEIMLPWGVKTPTGQVYYTTKKKINEIYCKSTFSLTPAQIAQIEAYRKGIVDGTIQIDANGLPVNATGTIPLLPEVGSNDGSQAAAVGSFASRIWSFIKWLFGY